MTLVEIKVISLSYTTNGQNTPMDTRKRAKTIFPKEELDNFHTCWNLKDQDEKYNICQSIIELYDPENPTVFELITWDIVTIGHTASPDEFIRNNQAVFTGDVLKAFIQKHDGERLKNFIVSSAKENPAEEPANAVKNKLLLSDASRELLRNVVNYTPEAKRNKLAAQIMLKLIGPEIIKELEMLEVPAEARAHLNNHPLRSIAKKAEQSDEHIFGAGLTTFRSLISRSFSSNISSESEKAESKEASETNDNISDPMEAFNILEHPSLTLREKFNCLKKMFLYTQEEPQNHYYGNEFITKLCQALVTLAEQHATDSLPFLSKIGAITRDPEVGKMFIDRNTSTQAAVLKMEMRT